MESPAEIHAALLAAIERVAEVARAAAPGPWKWGIDDLFAADDSAVVITDGGFYPPEAATAAHIALHDPASVLARTARDRARAERHRPAIDWGNPLLCHKHGDPWPCLDYRDLLADYGIEVP